MERAGKEVQRPRSGAGVCVGRGWSETAFRVRLQEALVNFVGHGEPLGRINENYNSHICILELLPCQHKTS